MILVRKNIIINAAVLFITAAIIEMTLHELAHFIAAIMVNAKEIALHHNSVSANTEALSLANKIFIKAAGPIVSLLIGILFHYICSKQTKRDMLFLFNLYMCIFGYIGFGGYLMISPLFTYGDTGYIFDALHFPMAVTIAIAMAGIVMLFFLMKNLMKYFVEMATPAIAFDNDLRISLINSILFYPLMIGTIITTLLNFPVPTFASLIAPICSPFTMLWTYGDALKKKYPADNMSKDMTSINHIQYQWLIVFVATAIINRLLVIGLSYH